MGKIYYGGTSLEVQEIGMLKIAYTNCVFSNTFKSNLTIIIKRRINIFRDCDEYKNTRPELVKVVLNINSFRSPQPSE